MKLIITETEKNRIRGLYYLNEQQNPIEKGSVTLTNGNPAIVGRLFDSQVLYCSTPIGINTVNIAQNRPINIIPPSTDFDTLNQGIYQQIRQIPNNAITSILNQVLLTSPQNLGLLSGNTPYNNFPQQVQTNIFRTLTRLRQTFVTTLVGSGNFQLANPQNGFSTQDVTNIVNNLIPNNPNLIITAFNTLTTSFNNWLRQTYPRVSPPNMMTNIYGGRLATNSFTTFDFQDSFSMNFQFYISRNDGNSISDNLKSQLEQTATSLGPNYFRDVLSIFTNNNRNGQITLPAIQPPDNFPPIYNIGIYRIVFEISTINPNRPQTQPFVI